MKRTLFIILFLSWITTSLFAQNQRTEDDNKISLQPKPQKNLDENDTFFNEISAKYGSVHIQESTTELYEVTAAHYFAPYWGVKTGITQIKNIGNMKHTWQIPLMFALRSTPFTTNTESNDIRNWFLSLLCFIPLQAEISAGVALGHLTPFHAEPQNNGEFYLHNRFMASLRGDIKLTLYLMRRVGIDFSFGGQYLLSSNFRKYHENIYSSEHNQVYRGFTNLAIGLSYRF